MLNARVTEIFSKIRRSVLINKIRAEVDECRRAAFDKIFYRPVWKGTKENGQKIYKNNRI